MMEKRYFDEALVNNDAKIKNFSEILLKFQFFDGKYINLRFKKKG